MAKKIDKFEFNKDLDKYVNKVSKSNQRFINLNEFIKKDNKTIDENNENQTELIELREKRGINLYWSRFLNLFRSKEIEKEVNETDEEEFVEEDIDEIEENIDEIETENDEFLEESEQKPKKFGCCFLKKIFSNNNEEILKLKKQNKFLTQDLKAISVFTKDLLELIPKENLEEFKIDGSLDEFKNILKKNNLLKKKE